MQLFSSVFDIDIQASVLSVGNFDGVHLGHRLLVNEVVESAKTMGLPSVIMTFEPHPVQVLFPQKGLKRVFNFEDQEKVFKDLGVDYFIKEPFSRALSSKSPQQFLTDWLLKPLKPKKIIVGYDFNFGANRSGGIDFLKEKANVYQFELKVIPPYKLENEIVSSSLIREEIEKGNIKKVNTLLGRNFYIKGIVEKGQGRGRKIGFPTANIFTKAEIFPEKGVYACKLSRSGKEYLGVTNVGVNPTFEEKTKRPIQVECHILDFSTDIYGENLELEFLDFIRPEKKFRSVDELIQQIQVDVNMIKKAYCV